MNIKLVDSKKIVFHAAWIHLLIGMLIVLLIKSHLASEESLQYFLNTLIPTAVLYIVVWLCCHDTVHQYVRYGFSLANYEKGWFWLAIMLGFIERIVIQFIIYFQHQFGAGFNSGTNQKVSQVLNLDQFLTEGIIGPIYDEFIFRILLFAMIAWIVHILSKGPNQDHKTSIHWTEIYNLNSKICWIVIVVSSILYSVAHGPDLTSFHIYAIGGLISGMLFVKFGYWAAVVQHFAYNYVAYSFFIILETLIATR